MKKKKAALRTMSVSAGVFQDLAVLREKECAKLGLPHLSWNDFFTIWAKQKMMMGASNVPTQEEDAEKCDESQIRQQG